MIKLGYLFFICDLCSHIAQLRVTDCTKIYVSCINWLQFRKNVNFVVTSQTVKGLLKHLFIWIYFINTDMWVNSEICFPLINGIFSRLHNHVKLSRPVVITYIHFTFMFKKIHLPNFEVRKFRNLGFVWIYSQTCASGHLDYASPFFKQPQVRSPKQPIL